MRRTQSRYTFVLDCRGGIYISQCRARDLEQVFPRWYQEMTKANIPDVVEIVAAFQAVGHLAATPVAGMVNVWLAPALVRQTIAVVKIIRDD